MSDQRDYPEHQRVNYPKAVQQIYMSGRLGQSHPNPQPEIHNSRRTTADETRWNIYSRKPTVQNENRDYGIYPSPYSFQDSRYPKAYQEPLESRRTLDIDVRGPPKLSTYTTSSPIKPINMAEESSNQNEQPSTITDEYADYDKQSKNQLKKENFRFKFYFDATPNQENNRYKKNSVFKAPSKASVEQEIAIDSDNDEHMGDIDASLWIKELSTKANGNKTALSTGIQDDQNLEKRIAEEHIENCVKKNIKNYKPCQQDDQSEEYKTQSYNQFPKSSNLYQNMPAYTSAQTDYFSRETPKEGNENFPYLKSTNQSPELYSIPESMDKNGYDKNNACTYPYQQQTANLQKYPENIKKITTDQTNTSPYQQQSAIPQKSPENSEKLTIKQLNSKTEIELIDPMYMYPHNCYLKINMSGRNYPNIYPKKDMKGIQYLSKQQQDQKDCVENPVLSPKDLRSFQNFFSTSSRNNTTIDENHRKAQDFSPYFDSDSKTYQPYSNPENANQKYAESLSKNVEYDQNRKNQITSLFEGISEVKCENPHNCEIHDDPNFATSTKLSRSLEELTKDGSPNIYGLISKLAHSNKSGRSSPIGQEFSPKAPKKVNQQIKNLDNSKYYISQGLQQTYDDKSQYLPTNSSSERYELKLSDWSKYSPKIYPVGENMSLIYIPFVTPKNPDSSRCQDLKVARFNTQHIGYFLNFKPKLPDYDDDVSAGEGSYRKQKNLSPNLVHHPYVYRG